MDVSKSKPVASKDNFLCVECGSTFIHHASLLRHRLRFHISGHKCSLCDMELRISDSEVGGFSDLKKHMLEAHEISTFYSCGCCCWIFNNKSALHMHCKSMNTSGLPGPAEPIATLLTDAYNAPEKSVSSDEVTGTNDNKASSPVSKKKIARRSSGPRPKKISLNSPTQESMLNTLYSYLTTFNQSLLSEAGEEERTVLVPSPNSSEIESHEGDKSIGAENADQSDLTNPESSIITNEIMELLTKNLEKPQRSESKSKSTSSELLYCRDCGVSFSNKSSLYRHSMKTHLEAHICSLCNEEILVSSTDGSDNMMRRHMLTLHNINNVYTCSCCFWAFDNKKDLYNHNHTMSTQGKPGDSRKIATSRKKQVPNDEVGMTRTITEDFLKLFNNDLNNIFNDLNESIGKDDAKVSEDKKPSMDSVSTDHLSDNDTANEGLDVPSSEEDEVKHDPTSSSRTAEQEGSLKRPDLKGQFCCLDCGKFFCHSASLHRHRAKAHPNDFECLLCNQVIQTKSVKEHMLAEHQIPTALICWCCGWYFESKKVLKLHVDNMKKHGETKDATPLAKSTGGGRPIVSRKKTNKSSEEDSLKDLTDFSSFVALFCPEVNDNESNTTGQSSREESPVETESISMENDENSKGKSLSPKLNAESFSSSKNDVITAVSPTLKREYDAKKSNKRRINDIASVLMSKKLKTSEA